MQVSRAIFRAELLIDLLIMSREEPREAFLELCDKLTDGLKQDLYLLLLEDGFFLDL